MFEELWSEINDAPGEIFDIPEMKEFNQDKEEQSFDKMLESSVEFWREIGRFWKCPPNHPEPLRSCIL